MKGLIETKKVAVYTTSDGKAFDNKDKAMKHQAEINLRGFFLSSVDGNEATAALVAQSILDDLDGFREVLGPLVRKPRGSKTVETVAEPAPAATGRKAA